MVWLVVGVSAALFWVWVCSVVRHVAVAAARTLLQVWCAVVGQRVLLGIFLVAGFLSWIAWCVKAGEPITKWLAEALLFWFDRTVGQYQYIKRRRNMMEVVVSYSQNAVDAGEMDGQLDFVQEETGPKQVLTLEFDMNRRSGDPRRRCRAVRLCALLVRGGLRANPKRRSDAQILVAEEWLGRQLEQMYDGSMRHTDIAWIVPVSVDLAYSESSLEVDLAQIRRTRALHEMRERVAGGSLLVRIALRILSMSEALHPSA